MRMLENLAGQVGGERRRGWQYASHTTEQSDAHCPIKTCSVEQWESEEYPLAPDMTQECWFVTQRWDQELGVHATIGAICDWDGLGNASGPGCMEKAERLVLDLIEALLEWDDFNWLLVQEPFQGWDVDALHRRAL